ncbi:MAG: HAD hydrolase-like protein [Bacteroidota bacterium]
MKTQLVVFDLAGTTVNDNKDVHRVLKKALANFDVNISIEDANEVMGIPKPIAIEKLIRKRYHGSMDIISDWIKEIHELFVEEMIYFYRTDLSVAEKDGVSETFKKLKANDIKVVVDTGFDRPITNAILQRMGWERNHLIDASVTSDEVLRGRPYPDMIFKAMELTSIRDISKVAKVGDTVSDLQEGNSAGCGLVIGVTTGAFSKQELEKEEHTHLIKQIPEIMEILGLKSHLKVFH